MTNLAMLHFISVFTTFVPHHLGDLKMGQNVRFITASKLVTGVIRYLAPEANNDNEDDGSEHIGVETAENINADLEWRKYFSW